MLYTRNRGFLFISDDSDVISDVYGGTAHIKRFFNLMITNDRWQVDIDEVNSTVAFPDSEYVSFHNLFLRLQGNDS